MDAAPNPQTWPAARLWDLRFAFSLLTRLPASACAPATAARAAQAAWAYPLAGAVVGAGAGAVFFAADAIGGSSPLAAALAVATALLLTGALHEDGLADLCDGAGVRGDAAAARAVAKQSTIGAYGTLSLIVDAALRIAALAALAAAAIPALLAAGALSRAAGAAALAWRASPHDGLARSVGQPPARTLWAAAATAALIVALAAIIDAAAAAATLIGLAGGVWAARRGAGVFGGVTGDVAGAVIRAVETGGLVAAALVIGALK